jgi:geranylgeranyl diphosphate synthase type I
VEITMLTVREGAGSFTAPADERARILEYLTQHMHETLGETGGLLAETTEYVLSTPGKLLRPLLLMDACKAAGGNPSVVVPAAAGTEYGHIASLVHDDIIDGDHERRGQPTLHTKYDLPTALLTGDFLIFQTFLCYTYCRDRGVSADRVLEAIRTLSTTCIEMCEGQALEAAIAGDLNTREETYLELIRLKTASFCRAVARIGACLAEASDAVVHALAEYGASLGMTFQIMDDVLSYDGYPLLLGKPLSSDIRNRHVTLPVIYAFKSGDQNVRERIASLFNTDVAESMATHEQLADILITTHALDRARGLACRYTNRAKQHLDLLPRSESRERLRTLADVLLARDR